MRTLVNPSDPAIARVRFDGIRFFATKSDLKTAKIELDGLVRDLKSHALTATPEIYQEILGCDAALHLKMGDTAMFDAYHRALLQKMPVAMVYCLEADHALWLFDNNRSIHLLQQCQQSLKQKPDAEIEFFACRTYGDLYSSVGDLKTEESWRRKQYQAAYRVNPKSQKFYESRNSLAKVLKLQGKVTEARALSGGYEGSSSLELKDLLTDEEQTTVEKQAAARSSHWHGTHSPTAPQPVHGR